MLMVLLWGSLLSRGSSTARKKIVIEIGVRLWLSVIRQCLLKQLLIRNIPFLVGFCSWIGAVEIGTVFKSNAFSDTLPRYAARARSRPTTETFKAAKEAVVCQSVGDK